jgi:hypothetical protein
MNSGKPDEPKYHLSANIASVQCLDLAGNHTRIEVLITDEDTGKVYKRIGDGRSIGNFHPIWVNWHGKRELLERLINDSFR